jgi:hypothetical protein
MRGIPGRRQRKDGTGEDLQTLRKTVGYSGIDLKTRKILLTQVESTDIDKLGSNEFLGISRNAKASDDTSRRRRHVWKPEIHQSNWKNPKKTRISTFPWFS